MAITTFQGPVRSLNGFYTQGPGSVITLPNATNTITLDVATYAGRAIYTNDATLVITLPSLNATADPAASGPGSDPNTVEQHGRQLHVCSWNGGYNVEDYHCCQSIPCWFSACYRYRHD
jgi:hypothetical protein